MGRHQIIYTSCMRGIEGVNDGQQVFSYDETFKESKSDEVKSLFSYQIPALPAGTLMSEEIAKTMPQAFSYRMLKSGSVAVTLNTYLGRDYMGSTGRFGNQLSHSIICDFDDFDIYPCEMYASTALRSSMEYEEVNNPEPPAFLETPELIKGYVIDADSVIEFLCIGDNLEYLKKMAAAMLKFNTEKKRVIICDEPENIAKWIAALQYALPMDIAKKINFTTYEFDPELSSAQICGVLSSGSRYNADSYVSSNRHYVFDFVNDRFNNIDADNTLLDFLDIAFSFSYESLTEFHDFIIEKTTYRDCDEGYYAAYYFYDLMMSGLDDVSQDQFDAIISFASEYLTDEVRKEMLLKLIGQEESIRGLGNGYALTVLGSMLSSLELLDKEDQYTVKKMLVDRLISVLLKASSEEEFMPLYENINTMAKNANISLPAEFMQPHNREALLKVLSQDASLWKLCFVIRVISDHVKEAQLPEEELLPDHSLGAIYFELVKIAYGAGRNDGFETVKKILDQFRDNPDYLINKALNIEGFLHDLDIAGSESGCMWDHVYKILLGMETSGIDTVNKCLAESGRYENMFALYEKQLALEGELGGANAYFKDYWNKWVEGNREYCQKYAGEILKTYEHIFERKKNTVSGDEKFAYAAEILNIAAGLKIRDEYAAALTREICGSIPLEKPKADIRDLIDNMRNYYIDVLRRPVDGRLLLMIIGIDLEKINDRRDLSDKLLTIRSMAAKGADFKEAETGEIKKYFEWAFDAAAKLRVSHEDLDRIFGIFRFDERSQSAFMEYWCKATYKRSANNKDYTDFSEFLLFMFEDGNPGDQELAGRYLCKLNKQKLEELDQEMKKIFGQNKRALQAWDNVRETAANTNPIANSLTHIFKKK